MNLDVMCELANYQANQSVWAKPFLWENLDKIEPIDWWKLLSRSTDLSKVAIKILTAPVTSAATERSFSTYSWIHSKRRNRLTNDRAGKLCAIAYNHKLQNLKSISNSPNPNLNNVFIESNNQTEKNEQIDIENSQEERFESESEEESTSSIIYMDTETEEEDSVGDNIHSD